MVSQSNVKVRCLETSAAVRSCIDTCLSHGWQVCSLRVVLCVDWLLKHVTKWVIFWGLSMLEGKQTEKIIMFFPVCLHERKSLVNCLYFAEKQWCNVDVNCTLYKFIVNQVNGWSENRISLGLTFFHSLDKLGRR